MKKSLTLAVALLLGLATINGHRLLTRDDDPDDIELNGSALKNQSDVALYAKTFISEGKNTKQIT